MRIAHLSTVPNRQETAPGARCAPYTWLKDKGAKVILSLRALVQPKGRWQQFWDKIDQYGSHVYA
ncbi:MAG: hypothetical protein CVV06_03385 [Gammaproteobacteria bacterium HGW-Gammaproteobacteria-10]|nr:MAG: hypothetical protein CVV06_03385 [Gammaproteobacteria bacterium HGW-Gammaproteobacteria-10]